MALLHMDWIYIYAVCKCLYSNLNAVSLRVLDLNMPYVNAFALHGLDLNMPYANAFASHGLH